MLHTHKHWQHATICHALALVPAHISKHIRCRSCFNLWSGKYIDLRGQARGILIWLEKLNGIRSKQKKKSRSLSWHWGSHGCKVVANLHLATSFLGLHMWWRVVNYLPRRTIYATIVYGQCRSTYYSLVGYGVYAKHKFPIKFHTWRVCEPKTFHLTDELSNQCTIEYFTRWGM